jgi:hypothetical protein
MYVTDNSRLNTSIETTKFCDTQLHGGASEILLVVPAAMSDILGIRDGIR